MTENSILAQEGHDFAVKIVKFLKEKTLKWKKETNITFSLSDPPSDYVCYKLLKIDKDNFGTIKDVTDKDHYTKTYHIDKKEEIKPLDKLKLEGEFENLSGEGMISAIKISENKNSIENLTQYIKFAYENNHYIEFDENIENTTL